MVNEELIKARRQQVLDEIIRDPGKTPWSYGVKLKLDYRGCNLINCSDSKRMEKDGLIYSVIKDGKRHLYPTDKGLAAHLKPGEVVTEEAKPLSYSFDKQAIKDTLREKGPLTIKELCLLSQGYYKPAFFGPFRTLLNDMCRSGILERNKSFPEVYKLVEKKAELPPPLYQSKPKETKPVSRDDLALQIAELITKIPTGLTEEQKVALVEVTHQINDAINLLSVANNIIRKRVVGE